MAAQANQEEAMGGDRARMILREAGHAYSDYQESSGKAPTSIEGTYKSRDICSTSPRRVTQLAVR